MLIFQLKIIHFKSQVQTKYAGLENTNGSVVIWNETNTNQITTFTLKGKKYKLRKHNWISSCYLK